VIVANAVRSDTSFAAYDITFAQNGFAVVSELSGRGAFQAPKLAPAPASRL
jgi:hypothetical protein